MVVIRGFLKSDAVVRTLVNRGNWPTGSDGSSTTPGQVGMGRTPGTRPVTSPRTVPWF